MDGSFSTSKVGYENNKQVTVKVEDDQSEVATSSDGYNMIKCEEIRITEEFYTKGKAKIDSEYDALHYSLDIKPKLVSENISAKFQHPAVNYELPGTVKTALIEDAIVPKTEISEQNCKQMTIKMTDDLDEVRYDDENNGLDLFQNVSYDVDVKRNIAFAGNLQIDMEKENLYLEEYINKEIITEGIKVEPETTQSGKEILCNKSQSSSIKVKQITEFGKHLKGKHDDVFEGYECEVSDFKADRKEGEWYHCQACVFRTEHKGALKVHYTVNHDNKADWHQCQACDFRSKSKKSLNRHFTIKHDKEAKWYECEVCVFKSKSKGTLKRHFTSKHDKEALWYQCAACDFRTKRKQTLKEHFTTKHDKEAELYQCQGCDYRTKFKQNLKQHFTLKHDKEADWFQCPACVYRTKYKKALKLHFRVKHDNEAEWYHCKICDFKSKNKRTLKRHCTTKHE